MQQLRWARGDEGWRIVSERDLRVIPAPHLAQASQRSRLFGAITRFLRQGPREQEVRIDYCAAASMRRSIAPDQAEGVGWSDLSTGPARCTSRPKVAIVHTMTALEGRSVRTEAASPTR
jgi:hypothetical protein